MLEFRVGVADSVAKSVAYRLLEPALSVAEPVRLIGSEGKFSDLLAQLALQPPGSRDCRRNPCPRRVSVKAFNHPLGATVMSFFATPALAATLQAVSPSAWMVPRC
jgi:LysR family transcriptional activator of nhaA